MLDGSLGLFGFKKKDSADAHPHSRNEGLATWLTYIEQSCNNHLADVLRFKHPEWDKALLARDYRTLVTMYSANWSAIELHADQMFSEWIKGARLVGIKDGRTTEFFFMVNRRFSHLAQIRSYLDYQLKLTLVSREERERLLPTLERILSSEMSDAFFPTPATIPE